MGRIPGEECRGEAVNVLHPTKVVISVAQAMEEWAGRGTWQIKLDGVFTVLPVTGGILVGETVGNQFTAFDCVERGGTDARVYPLADRLAWRGELCRTAGLPEVAGCDFNGADFLKHVLGNGLEGVVMKSPGSYYDNMVAAKRSIVVTVRVSGFCGGSQSVTIADAATGQDRGKVTLRGGKCDLVRIGSVLRVEGMNLTDAGKIRQPVLAREWLVSR